MTELYETRDLDFMKGLIQIPGMSRIPPHLEKDFLDGLKYWITIPENIILTDGHNVITFEKLREVSYECHLLFQKKYRGKYAIKKTREMFKYMKDKHGAKTILGTVPVEDKATRLFCRLVGCTPVVTVDHPAGEGEVFQYLN